MRENNHIIIIGDAAGKAEFSHMGAREAIYRLPVAVERLSGTNDELNVLAPESMLREIEGDGARIFVEGEVRSFNNRFGTGAKLVISVLARTLCRTGLDYRNELELRGVVVKAPVYRKTPMGREITDLLVASPREHRGSDYLPVIAWGAGAVEAADYSVGDIITLHGRLQSRKYIKNLGDTSEERTAFEISAGEILRG